MRKTGLRKNIIIVVLILAVALGVSVRFRAGAHAGEKRWDISFDKVSGNSALGVRTMKANNVKGYRAMQGIGFDTYSGEDGYVFMQSDDLKSYSLSHFKMDEDGFCTKVYKKTYLTENVGHANDITIYKDPNGVKWLFFAPCGLFGEDNTAKGTDGKALKLGAIRLDASGNPRDGNVYSCNVSELSAYFAGGDENKGNITGITYMGKKYIKKSNGENAERQVFLIMNAKEIYETYITQNGNSFSFIPTYTSGRINKPTLPSGEMAATQGIAYHNRYVYITGEGKEDKATEMAVARISLDTLFSRERHYYHDMEVYKANMNSGNVKKHGPEGAFFTSLNDKSHLYVGVNRRIVEKGVDRDDDEIMRTQQRF